MLNDLNHFHVHCARPLPFIGLKMELTVSRGVALILDIDLKLLEQPSVEDESVNSMAGSQRSLSARARSCTMCWPVSFFQSAPQRFILISNRLLQVASTLPVPSAKPSRRRTGIA